MIVEGERGYQRTLTDLTNLYVRSERTPQLIPLANLVRLEKVADSIKLNRYNRVRSIIIVANLAEGLVLGDALSFLEGIAAEHLPGKVILDYKGQCGVSCGADRSHRSTFSADCHDRHYDRGRIPAFTAFVRPGFGDPYGHWHGDSLRCDFRDPIYLVYCARRL